VPTPTSATHSDHSPVPFAPSSSIGLRRASKARQSSDDYENLGAHHYPRSHPQRLHLWCQICGGAAGTNSQEVSIIVILLGARSGKSPNLLHAMWSGPEAYASRLYLVKMLCIMSKVYVCLALETYTIFLKNMQPLDTNVQPLDTNTQNVLPK